MLLTKSITIILNNVYICKKYYMKTDNKKIKSVKLDNALIKRIEAKAKKERRTPHFLMVEALEKAFK